MQPRAVKIISAWPRAVKIISARPRAVDILAARPMNSARAPPRPRISPRFSAISWPRKSGRGRARSNPDVTCLEISYSTIVYRSETNSKKRIQSTSYNQMLIPKLPALKVHSQILGYKPTTIQILPHQFYRIYIKLLTKSLT